MTNTAKEVAEKKGLKLPFISDSTYEFFRNNVELVLPALAVFYVTIAGVWGLPFGDQVSQTINALALLLGILIKVNRARVDKIVTAVEKEDALAALDNQVGAIVVHNGPDEGLATLALDIPMNEVKAKDEITLRVERVNLPGE